jgi:hypothetical protein
MRLRLFLLTQIFADPLFSRGECLHDLRRVAGRI